jgi:hypothetical protein
MRKTSTLPVWFARGPLCPSCSGRLAVRFGNAVLTGDWTVCGHCCAVLRFTEDASGYRVAVASEIEEAVDKGDMDPRDARFLRGAQAEHVRRQGAGPN